MSVVPAFDKARAFAARAAALGSATIHEASGRAGALPAPIRSMTSHTRFAGPAVTVSGPPGDNLWLHRGLVECKAGDVLVAHLGNGYEWGYWGEIMSWAAQARGLAAVVLDGCVRDLKQLDEIGVPIHARGSAILGTSKHSDSVGAINAPIILGNVVVNPGDWLVGDEDGVVAVEAARLEAVLDLSEKRVATEAEIITQIQGGTSTLDAYDF